MKSCFKQKKLQCSKFKPNKRWVWHGSLWNHLVGVEDFTGQRIVSQGAGRTGAAVVQHFSTVLHLLLVLLLQICCTLHHHNNNNSTRPCYCDIVKKKITLRERFQVKKKVFSIKVWIATPVGSYLQRAKDHWCSGCSSVRSPAPPWPGSSHFSATSPPPPPPPSANPDELRLSPSPSGCWKTRDKLTFFYSFFCEKMFPKYLLKETWLTDSSSVSTKYRQNQTVLISGLRAVLCHWTFTTSRWSNSATSISPTVQPLTSALRRLCLATSIFVSSSLLICSDESCVPYSSRTWK